MSDSGMAVLLIEDDESLRNILATQLRAAGRTVVGAGSAEEATEALGGGLRPGLVLLDLNLPGDTGWEFLRGPQLLAAGSPPVVITSATAVSPRRLAEFHVAGYLPKPCPIDTMLETVDRLLERAPSEGPE